MQLWSGALPDRYPAELVRELYAEENRGKAEPSGSQDMIGLIYHGVNLKGTKTYRAGAALLGAPLFAVIAASAMIGFTREGIDLQAIAIEFYGIAEMPILLAIPLFTFAGYVLSESDAPKRLVRLTSTMIGWMPGGLALVALAASGVWLAGACAARLALLARARGQGVRLRASS